MICPRCDAEAAAGSRFCNQCGGPLSVAASRQDQTRLVTILFADMSGSVRATQGLDPEAALERVNEALEVMSREIVAHGGSIDRYLGDGVLALFGVPRSSEDDPLRAIASALSMVDRTADRDFDLTVGINTGDAYVGKVGSEAHREITAMGPVVNLAARLQHSCAPGEIVVGDATWRVARRAFEFESREVEVKGLPDPVPAWRVIRARPRPERVRGLEGLPAAVVGREAELARLEGALGRAREGVGHTVTVVGEAGVGKSTLVQQIRRLAEAIPGEQVVWLEGRCFESSASLSYAPFVDLLRNRFDPGSGRARPDPIIAELETLAADGALEADQVEDVLVPLLNVLSIPEPRAAVFGELSPQEIKSHTFRALLSYLSALVSRRPAVIVLDDLHWADSLTLELVPRLVQDLKDSRALVVCVQRPAQEHSSRHMVSLVAGNAGDRHIEISLRPLDDTQGRQLVFGLLGTDEFPETALRAILEKAQGNPLFLEEILRSLMASGQITRGRERVEIPHTIRVDDVPATVQSIIQSRVDRIDEQQREVLRTAAVIGRLFPRRLLEAVADPEADIDRSLWHLEQHELVYLDRAVPEAVYSFHHVFTRDTVYKSLLKRRREELHHAVGRALERLYAERLEEQVEALAYHYERSADGRRAAEFLFRAGEKARRAHLNEEAVASFERALLRLEAETGAVTDDSPGSRDATRELRARVLESLGDVLELGGRHDEAVEILDRALRDRGAEERTERGRILRKAGLARQVQRRREEALAMFDRAIDALGSSPEQPDLVWNEERAAVELGRVMVHYFTSDADTLARQIERSRPVVEARGNAFQRGWLYNTLALLGLRRERYLASEETVEFARAGYLAARDESTGMEAADIHFNYGFCLLWANHLDEAERHLLEVLDEADRTGYTTLRSRCVTYLALIARRRGDVGSARRWAEVALRAAQDGGIPEYMVAAQAHLAWAALREGNHEEGARLAQRAFDACREIGGPYRVLGWIAAWPLLDVELGRDNLPGTIDLARYLLAEESQPAPPPVARALAAAVTAFDAGDAESARTDMIAATEQARESGHL